jgi:hypothetical protein
MNMHPLTYHMLDGNRGLKKPTSIEPCEMELNAAECHFSWIIQWLPDFWCDLNVRLAHSELSYLSMV